MPLKSNEGLQTSNGGEGGTGEIPTQPNSHVSDVAFLRVRHSNIQQKKTPQSRRKQRKI